MGPNYRIRDIVNVFVSFVFGVTAFVIKKVESKFEIIASDIECATIEYQLFTFDSLDMQQSCKHLSL